MLIREWKFEDILAISELEKECFETDTWSYKTFVSCFENPNFIGIVGVEGDEIVGFGGITVAADSADLENVFVSEAYRKSGNGSALVDELLSRAKIRGAVQVFLEVRVSNSPAMLTYLKRGFVGAYTRARYYSNGEDCLMMKKDI